MPSAVRNKPPLVLAELAEVVVSLVEGFIVSVQGYHDFLKARRVLTPASQRIRSFFEWNNQAHHLIDGKLPCLKESDDRKEIFGKSISRSQDIQFFLHEEPRLIAHRFLGVPDVDDSSPERDFFDSGPECYRKSDGFDHHIRTRVLPSSLTSARARLPGRC